MAPWKNVETKSVGRTECQAENVVTASPDIADGQVETVMNENSLNDPGVSDPGELRPEAPAEAAGADESVTADQVIAEAVSDEGGQATVETVILIAAMILALTASFKAFPGIVRDYYFEMTRLMIYPIP